MDMAEKISGRKIIDEKKQMKYVNTIKLANGKEVDVYEVSPNVSKFVFRKEKKEGGYKLVPE